MASERSAADARTAAERAAAVRADLQTALQDLLRRIRADARVRKVYDEIQVVSTEEQVRRRDATTTKASQREGASRVASDLWIETKISAQLIAAQNVTSVNYRFRSVRRTIYLIGSAQSRTELNSVLAIVKATEGVSQVKPFIDIKPSAET